MIEEYITHWWTGDLATTYTLWGLTIPQINKVFRILQYLVGLMALFELLQFSTVMRALKTVSFLSIFTIRTPSYIMNIPVIIMRLTAGLIAVLGGGIGFKDMITRAVKVHYGDATRGALASANAHIMVRLFEWLEQHPLRENVRRSIVFGSFVVLSLGDLLTS